MGNGSIDTQKRVTASCIRPLGLQYRRRQTRIRNSQLGKRRVAFYAPLKPPDHHIPSGDRQMARMLFSALEKAGYETVLASRYISYSKRSDSQHLAARRDGAAAEAERLLIDWQRRGGTPDLWFCYHPYDKSVDWIGPIVCKALNIPLVNIEPCKTGQGQNNEWGPWRTEAQKSILAADINIVMTPSDRAYLDTFVGDDHIREMPPFIDPDLLIAGDDFPATKCRAELRPGIKLLTLGMMRPGAKLESYQVLATALQQILNLDWNLVIAGGGPGETEIRAMFGEIATGRVHFAGECTPQQAISLIKDADILAWPGCREAYGMVYLEAAAHGVPSVALDNMGVPLVVADGVSGLLANPPDAKHYSACLAQIITDNKLRRLLAAGAKAFVREQRSVDGAAMRLKEILQPLFVDNRL